MLGVLPLRRAFALEPTPVCAETEDNIEGPFYRQGAPFRSDIVDQGMEGVRLSVSGTVSGAGCADRLPGALLDFWQADDAGHYDNDGSIVPLPPDLFILRGKMTAGGAGEYALNTIIPGPYPNGGVFRPSHIHVKVSAPGYQALTTQLYFEDDPYAPTDPYIRDSLIMSLSDAPGGGKAATFNFVLAPV